MKQSSERIVHHRDQIVLFGDFDYRCNVCYMQTGF